MVKCQVCGEEIGNAIFCENCGFKIPSQKKKIIISFVRYESRRLKK